MNRKQTPIIRVSRDFVQVETTTMSVKQYYDYNNSDVIVWLSPIIAVKDNILVTEDLQEFDRNYKKCLEVHALLSKRNNTGLNDEARPELKRQIEAIFED